MAQIKIKHKIQKKHRVVIDFSVASEEVTVSGQQYELADPGVLAGFLIGLLETSAAGIKVNEIDLGVHAVSAKTE